MKIVNSIKELKSYLAEEKRNNKQIGFVPTMGALHDGHLSLVKRCVDGNDVCVVSVLSIRPSLTTSMTLKPILARWIKTVLCWSRPVVIMYLLRRQKKCIRSLIPVHSISVLSRQ